ncbi:MAG TPA: transcription-repair coupling factor, partial [Bacteroidota bacterium]|nr:transcription-repair coupling factor [Bacteroidota bacterium]
MIEQIKKTVYASAPFAELKARLSQREVRLRGVSGSLRAFVASFVFEHGKSQLLMVTADDDSAEKIRDDCAVLLGEDSVNLFSSNVARHAKVLDMTAPIGQIETLQRLSKKDRFLIVASARALTDRIPQPATFTRRSFSIERSKDHPFAALLERLGEIGFERKEFVEEYGDYAVRGGILDVFPFIGENPIRIEFWGDTVESIREFDVLSQRSIRDLQSATIVASLDQPNGDTNSSTACLVDYLDSNASVFIDEPELIAKELEELGREQNGGDNSWRETLGQLERFPRLVHESLNPATDIQFESHSQPAINGSIRHLLGHVGRLSSEGINLYITCDTREEASRIQELIEEELTSPSGRELTFGDTDATDEDFAFPGGDDRSGEPQPPGPPVVQTWQSNISKFLLTETLHAGFIFPAARIALFTEHEIFGRLKRRGMRRKRAFRGFSAKEVQQLKRGDFVVHVDYGIGRFAGLHKIKIRGIEQEAMKVEYAERDTLYVNLNFVNRVQKYSSQEGHVPTLTRLGSPDWERLKGRARRKIKDIARDLIKLYAKRKHEEGFAFSPDTHWQKEMEASFMYEDTPDQATATLAVKSDMESRSPMDRLVCGDVGFGKTEVAVRAAFKAVMDGKQVAVLVPTTILAQQHFNTFTDRLSRYSVRVESLSRFKSKKEQTATLGALKERRVDILIGTHRILSKDIEFLDLGLLIIDEEHRFGVSAKEKLRQLRATVDTLTLTATPIPRTLQFSLMGSRDLSIINTPPRNRLPIVTEIAPVDWKLIREAILKELHRGGQVYFIHDRVQNMDEMLAILEKHVPEARVHTAHGQMKGHELERTMLDFLEKKYNVLLCTKIIESGIDIPSVNTIIIHRADRFGLAELYQLRGRVGRSNVQAYAFLLTPPPAVLPKQTLRRLQAIQEFTELGSGFNLAMRDLEIRGAGNLLGAEQSGMIVEMGFELYQRIVEEAVQELKEEEFQELVTTKAAGVSTGMAVGRPVVECVVETDVEALIPDVYIESDGERLDIYRRLYKAASFEEISELRTELRDRFGDYPVEVENLFLIVELKIIASQIPLSRLELNNREISTTLPPAEMTSFYEPVDGRISPFQAIMNFAGEMKNYRLRL